MTNKCLFRFALALSLLALLTAPAFAAEDCTPVQSVDLQPVEEEALDLDQLLEQSFTPQPEEMVVVHLTNAGCACRIYCSGRCVCDSTTCCDGCCEEGFLIYC